MIPNVANEDNDVGREVSISSAILDAMPDAALLVASDGTIVYANARTNDLLGWPAGELVGRSVDALVPMSVAGRHPSLRHRFANDSRPRPMGTGLELNAVRRDGTEIAVEISLSPLRLDGDDSVIAAIRDGRPQRELRNEEQRAAELLEASRSRVALLEDRDRIGRDLHDGVIQRLFAAGLHLQAAIGRADRDDRIIQVIDEIDDSIKQIRTAIFTLHGQRGLSTGLEHGLRVAVAEAGRLLNHEPTLRMGDGIETVPEELGAEVLTVVRELLTNIVKHAHASASIVDLSIESGSLRLVVSDDGVGMDADALTAGSGVANVSERAHQRGGSSTVAPNQGGGTAITWSVPLG